MKLSIDSIVDEWKSDSVLDETKLSTELARIPNLHSKYLEVYLTAKQKYISSASVYNKLKFIRKKYYRGEMTREELNEYGWDQYQGLKMSHTEFNATADIDPVLNDEWIKVEYWKGVVSGLEFIMKEIQNRGYTIKTMVEYNKIIMGG